MGVHLTEKDDKGYRVEPPNDVMALLDEPLQQDDLLLVIGHALWLMKEGDRAPLCQGFQRSRVRS